MPRYELRDIPQLDLHPYCHDSGGDVEGALHKTRLFVLEHLAAGDKTLEIIHGRGVGRLKELVHEILAEYEHNHLVLRYNLLSSNAGVTEVHLPSGRKAESAAPAGPEVMRTRPFEELSGAFQKLLKEPAKQPDVPAPLIVVDGERRLAKEEFTTLEEYAKQLVKQRAEASAPPAALPRRLPKQTQSARDKKVEPIQEGHARSDLEDQAREAWEAAGPTPPAAPQRRKPKG